MRKCFALCICGLSAGTTTACGTEPVCTLDVVPAVIVDIRDGFDAAPLAETARGAVREGDFADSLQPYRSVGNGVLVSRAAAWEREGLYSVTVEHAGYADWHRDGVRVRQRDECHVEPVELTAYLQRTP
jgi:hypothetical protein